MERGTQHVASFSSFHSRAGSVQSNQSKGHWPACLGEEKRCPDFCLHLLTENRFSGFSCGTYWSGFLSQSIIFLSLHREMERATSDSTCGLLLTVNSMLGQKGLLFRTFASRFKVGFGVQAWTEERRFLSRESFSFMRRFTEKFQGGSELNDSWKRDSLTSTFLSHIDIACNK